MKKILATLAVAIVALVGFAPAAQAGPREDRQYVALIRSEIPMLRSASAKKLIEVAKTTCRTLRSGVPILDVVAVAEESGFDEDEAISLVAAAITFYCIDQKDNF